MQSRETRDRDGATAPLRKRLGWLVLIWVASVLTLGGVAWLMRLFMNAIGLQTN
ncbi:DUF2474 domain-containing protein [Alloalcanivorax sp.]|jgi:hypothetical protein|uniref:DUF2474 domain-containing protein n=1 Tax=Alloalcanivorax TaxID=3020832 RepID=UPI0013218448|nr:DUF2474 domain-containing protein [Pseudomonadota bacterium]MTI50428.1 DUF2474 domain-containing protein [Alcanivorax sp.]